LIHSATPYLYQIETFLLRWLIDTMHCGRYRLSLQHHPGAVMKKLLIAALVLFSVTAHAQTTCRSDGFGNTTCTTGSGSTTFRRDGFGNTTGTDGSVMRSDGFGNTTITRPQQPSTTYRNDGFGNTIGSDGTTMRNDGFGNTIITSPRGKQTVCRNDGFGNTICQ
jgi:hypothetical protein